MHTHTHTLQNIITANGEVNVTTTNTVCGAQRGGLRSDTAATLWFSKKRRKDWCYY